MDAYVNDLNSIQKLLVIIREENSLGNYLEQLQCALKCELFTSQDLAAKVSNEYDLDTDEIKQKYLFKINQSISQCLEKINGLV